MTETILLIDDDEDIHLQTRIIVEKAGCKFLSALNANDGLRLVREENPELIILDFLMPAMDGLETYTELKNSFASREEERPGVIMLTAANHTFAEKRSLLEFGIDAYLQKPFGPRELINVIENVFVTRDIKRSGIRLVKAVENSRDFLENLVESCPAFIVTTDLSGRITYANKAVETLLSYDADQVVGKQIEILSQALSSEISNMVDKGSSVRSGIIECLIATRAGSSIPAECTLSLLRQKTGEVSGILIVGEDISARKKLERELLEKERLTALTESFATINHKLNNPLTPLLGNLQLLRQDEPELNNEQKKRIEIIESNAKRISEIVKSFGELTNPITKSYYGDANIIEFIAEEVD